MLKINDKYLLIKYLGRYDTCNNIDCRNSYKTLWFGNKVGIIVYICVCVCVLCMNYKSRISSVGSAHDVDHLC